MWERESIVCMKWVMERAAAALLIAGSTGTIVALVITAVGLAASWPDPRAVRAGDLIGGLAGLCGFGFVYGAVAGTIPGTLVVCLSNAKYRPWRAGPILSAGTVAGALSGICLSNWTPLLSVLDAVNVETIYVVPAFATLGGIVAALFVRKPLTVTA